jgi:hypothetical protein
MQAAKQSSSQAVKQSSSQASIIMRLPDSLRTAANTGSFRKSVALIDVQGHVIIGVESVD